jgi:HEAT repeat protein
MIGLEPWEKRGGQLVRYLPKETNPELQMGAVSGLADMFSEAADQALIRALRDLNDANRALALNALVKRDAAVQVLKAIEQQRVSKAALSESHRAELLKHRNPAVREEAKKLFN